MAPITLNYSELTIVTVCIIVINVILLIITIYVYQFEKMGLVGPPSDRQKMTKFENGRSPDVASVVFMGARLGF